MDEHCLQDNFNLSLNPCYVPSSDSSLPSCSTMAFPQLDGVWQQELLQEPAPTLHKDIVKMELLKAIKDKRQAKGEELPTVEYKEQPQPQPKPPEKPEDIKIRREKNKIAAKKCRMKSKESCFHKEKKIEFQQNKCAKLTANVEKLRKEVDSLKALMQNHTCVLHQQPDCCFNIPGGEDVFMEMAASDEPELWPSL